MPHRNIETQRVSMKIPLSGDSEHGIPGVPGLGWGEPTAAGDGVCPAAFASQTHRCEDRQAVAACPH